MEHESLPAEPAGHDEHERQWRVALDLPLSDAIRAAGLLPPGWRPPDEEGQRLLHLLRAASPELVASVAATPETTIRLDRFTRIDCRFAQDGTDLAVRTRFSKEKYHDGPLVTRDVIGVYGLPSGRIIARLPGMVPPARRGRESPFWNEHSLLHRGRGIADPVPGPLRRLVPFRRRVPLGSLSFLPYSPPPLAVPGGLARHEDGRLRYQTPDGEYDYPETFPDGDGGFIEERLPSRWFTADPISGRIAFLARPSGDRSSRDHIVVLDRDGQLIGLSRNLGAEPHEYLQWLGFAGPDLLITYGYGRFRAWPVGGSERISPAAEITGFPVPEYDKISERVPDMLSLAGLIVVGGRCLNAVTLSEVDMPGWLAEMRPWTWPFFAPGGTHIAALTDWHFNGTFRVRSLWQRQLGDLFTRPLASAGAADVTRLAQARALLAHPDVRGVLALLRACIAYRLTRDPADASERPKWPGPELGRPL